MIRWLRLLQIFLLSLFRKKILLTDTATLSFRVWPTEADMKYMNNSSFWTIAEMGIMDIYFRSELVKVCRKKKWIPLMTSQKMVYRKPLKRFTKFQLRTKTIYWDDKFLYFNITFSKDSLLIANCLIGTVVKSKEGIVSPKEVTSSLGIMSSLPYKNIDDTDIIDQSINIDRLLLEQLKNS